MFAYGAIWGRVADVDCAIFFENHSVQGFRSYKTWKMAFPIDLVIAFTTVSALSILWYPVVIKCLLSAIIKSHKRSSTLDDQVSLLLHLSVFWKSFIRIAQKRSAISQFSFGYIDGAPCIVLHDCQKIRDCNWNFSARRRRSFWYGSFEKFTQPRLQITSWYLWHFITRGTIYAIVRICYRPTDRLSVRHTGVS